MPKTKKFIDKKNAVTFNLVHRSQKDPLAADETAPQRVLVPVSSKSEKANELHTGSKSKDPGKQREEQVKYGIYYDDDYDYLQHLRDASQKVEWELSTDSPNNKVWKAPVARGISDNKPIKLPSSVFASDMEEKVGLLNLAAPHTGPRLDLDPDIVAALDDDFDFDDPNNELEDDFITIANATGNNESDEDEEVDDDGDEEDKSERDSEEDDDFNDEFNLNYEETKSRFTEYSMTSSVIRRNTQLTLLDDRFEQMMAEYDEEEMGALDCEEIEGYIDPQDSRVLELAKEYEYEKTLGQRLGREIGKVARDEVEKGVEDYFAKCGSDEENSVKSSDEEDVPEKKWDCESILSTYSTLYNHPKLIEEPRSTKIKVCPKTGIPLNVLGKPALTKKYLDQLDQAQTGRKDDETQSVISTLSTISIRPKDETPEQRKERKQLVKEYRKERRIEKKANTLAFKEEKKLQEKQQLNNRANVHGLKLL